MSGYWIYPKFWRTKRRSVLIEGKPPWIARVILFLCHGIVWQDTTKTKTL